MVGRFENRSITAWRLTIIIGRMPTGRAAPYMAPGSSEAGFRRFCPPHSTLVGKKSAPKKRLCNSKSLHNKSAIVKPLLITLCRLDTTTAHDKSYWALVYLCTGYLFEQPSRIYTPFTARDHVALKFRRGFRFLSCARYQRSSR